MTFSCYLKDRILPILLVLGAIAFASMVLFVMNVNLEGIMVTVAVLLLGCGTALLWSYLSKRRFYKELNQAIQTIDEAYYASELLRRPSFAEGILTYDAIQLATKHMNDRIAQYRLSSEEYQEYIETWIHEIKTPIAASRLTIDNRNDKELRPLEKEMDRIEAFVEQALYYARSSAVEKDYSIKSVELESAAKEVVKHHSRALIEHDIKPEFTDLSVTVFTDPKWLEFILGQIVANAIKYQDRAGKEQSVLRFFAEVDESKFDEKQVVLHIQDNGIGIPVKDVDRVFEKGFTGENGRKFSRSTGIGLYLCKKLCTQMKLGITLSSEEGIGTTVSITFPLNKMYFLE